MIESRATGKRGARQIILSTLIVSHAVIFFSGRDALPCLSLRF